MKASVAALEFASININILKARTSEKVIGWRKNRIFLVISRWAKKRKNLAMNVERKTTSINDTHNPSEKCRRKNKISLKWHLHLMMVFVCKELSQWQCVDLSRSFNCIYKVFILNHRLLPKENSKNSIFRNLFKSFRFKITFSYLDEK